MKNEKISKSLNLIADAAESGYTALFTYAVKESLSQQERTELVSSLRALAEEKSIDINLVPHLLDHRNNSSEFLRK